MAQRLGNRVKWYSGGLTELNGTVVG